MARDTKLQFTFLRDVVAAAATGGMQVNNLAGTAGSTAAAQIIIPAAGTAYNFNRGASNALNFGGFRATLGDAASFAAQANPTAIPNDPALLGMNTAMESYVRVTYALIGNTTAATTQTLITVEAASDSGTGTAGTDWTPISAGVNAGAGSAARLVPSGTAAAGVFTSTAHGLVVGDIVNFTSAVGGTNLTASKPYFVNTVPTANSFTLSNSLNGATDATIAVATSFVAYATPLQKRIVSIPIVPTVKPWVRVAVSIVAGATGANTQQGVWIQDAFYTLGRDMSALA